MKIGVLLGIVLSLCGCSFSNPTANVLVAVVDEEGHRIEGCAITVHFENEPKYIVRTGISKTNELFEAQAPAMVPYATVVVNKDGYYESGRTYMFTDRDAALNQYKPWGKQRTLTLREIIDPKAGHKGGYYKISPKFNTPLGFDVMKGDWVKPYGNGVLSDFIFTVHQREDGKVSEYAISFSNEGDGIQECKYLYETTSAFRWPYQAPIDGYNSEFKKVIGYKGVDVKDEERIKDPGKSRYVFRVRTEYDENGEIKSALYGKIKGEIIVYSKGIFQFGYWLNDDTQSRSLESTHPTSP